MKKSLLFAFAMCGALTINAMKPLTPEQLSKLSVQINTTDGNFSSNATVGLEYTDESNPTTIKIQNFNNSGLAVSLYVNWEEGTLYAPTQTFGYDSDYVNMLMIVNEAAADLSSPMDDEFQNSRITGKISENGISLDPWTIVAVPGFSSIQKLYDKPFTTNFVIANATMSQERYDWDFDWENLEILATQEFRIYTEVDGTDLIVYGWDDLESRVKFTRNVDNNVYTYSTEPTSLIYKDKKRDWFLCTLPGTTWDDLDGFKQQNATALTSNPIADASEITFDKWIVVNFGEDYNNERSFGASAKIKLDTPLQLGTSGIDGNVAAEEPVKVAYYNLNGVETANPASGIFVKVSTFADGSAKAEKVVK